jgi:hypothetical protein
MSMFPYSITIAPRTVLTTAGAETFGTPVPYKADVQEMIINVTTPEGVQTQAPGCRIFLPGRPSVSNGSKVVHGSRSFQLISDPNPTPPGNTGSTQLLARLL